MNSRTLSVTSRPSEIVADSPTSAVFNGIDMCNIEHAEMMLHTAHYRQFKLLMLVTDASMALDIGQTGGLKKRPVWGFLLVRTISISRLRIRFVGVSLGTS